MAHLLPTIPPRRIGFVSTRFSTTDGVSLETDKWAHVLSGLGHQIFYFAGLCNRPPEVSYVVPEAHFDYPEIREISNIAYQLRERPFNVTRRIRELQWHLKQHLYKFIQQFNIEYSAWAGADRIDRRDRSTDNWTSP
jgi:hypothetical protein